MDPSLILNSAVFIKERQALLSGLGSHAYIIEGAEGIGKNTFALAAASVHFCLSENKPCLTCSGCKKVLEGIHPDVHRITPEKNILRVDQVREVISTLYETPYEGRSKIYIFEKFHLANEQAQNALLKTLEEPPKAVTFFLLAENALSLLPTVRSRCKKIRLTELDEGDILSFLKKNYPENENVLYASRQAMGNIGTAIRLIEDEEYVRINKICEDILSSLDEKPSSARLSVLFEKEKNSFLEILTVLENKLRAKFLKTNGERELLQIKAVQDAITAKNKNINGGLIYDSLAYSLAKGGNTWHR
ncbi:MAG: DNA polymerase III subunit [Clostridia bacterium]|nr:DNA polymerase III subunit [Clostridia bacterium]